MIPGRVAVVAALVIGAGVEALSAESPGLRRPSAMVLSADGSRLFVANHGRGSVSVVATEAPKVVAEVGIGRALSDLAAVPGGDRLLAADDRAHQILVLDAQGDSLQVKSRIDVPAYPVGVRPAADGKRAFVASLWSRRLAIVDLDEGRVTSTVDLPFNPRRLLPIESIGKLVVADGFGGMIAVVDLATARIDSVRTMRAHNITALAVHPRDRRLLVTHQIAYSSGQTTSDDIHWGFLVTNAIRDLSFDALIDPDADLTRGATLLTFSRPGDGAGDPSGLVIGEDGTTVAALAGIDKVQISTVGHSDGLRAETGRRPSALAVDFRKGRAYVANSLDDSLSVVDIAGVETVATLPLGPKPIPSLAEQGERLFSDARLSQEGWMSCHSCHVNGHSSHLRVDTLGDGAYGAPKRIPSLLGAADTAPYAWDGSMPDLEAQIRKSVKTTMRGRPLTDDQALALAAYVKTLATPPPVAALNGKRDAEAIAAGRATFGRHCQSCHGGPQYASPKTFDVGLVDEDGRTEFNPPSLRGLSQRDAFLHDGRARSIVDVLTVQGHPNTADDGQSLSERELADLVAFLNDL